VIALALAPLSCAKGADALPSTSHGPERLRRSARARREGRGRASGACFRFQRNRHSDNKLAGSAVYSQTAIAPAEKVGLFCETNTRFPATRPSITREREKLRPSQNGQCCCPPQGASDGATRARACFVVRENEGEESWSVQTDQLDRAALPSLSLRPRRLQRIERHQRVLLTLSSPGVCLGSVLDLYFARKGELNVATTMIRSDRSTTRASPLFALALDKE